MFSQRSVGIVQHPRDELRSLIQSGTLVPGDLVQLVINLSSGDLFSGFGTLVSLVSDVGTVVWHEHPKYVYAPAMVATSTPMITLDDVKTRRFTLR